MSTWQSIRGGGEDRQASPGVLGGQKRSRLGALAAGRKTTPPDRYKMRAQLLLTVVVEQMCQN